MTYFFASSFGGSKICLCERSEAKTVFFIVIASMTSEQTCLQGFASDGIHKTIGVFLKNAKNRQVFVRR